MQAMENRDRAEIIRMVRRRGRRGRPGRPRKCSSRAKTSAGVVRDEVVAVVIVAVNPLP